MFPSNTFLPGGDLTPIKENIDRILDGLTKWEPKTKEKGVVKLPKITVEGEDYPEAMAKMNNLFLRNLWSDGLPMLPPTTERVDWILTGTDLSRDTIVGGGNIQPRGGITSVEMIAVCLAMAGGRPEYLPVLIAATEAMTHPQVVLSAWSTTTGPTTPVVIVNGPVAKQIRLNRGYGCLGPSSEFPAGVSIGRAIRFLLMNLGGAIPGRGTMSLYGGPGRYGGLVFAEDEDRLPPDWEPLNVEQGYPRGSNSLTFHVVDQTGQVWLGQSITKEDTMNSLNDWARTMAVTAQFPTWQQWWHPAGAPGYLLICCSTAQGLSELGWSKEKVKVYLWEHARCHDSDPIGWSGETLKEMIERLVKQGGLPKEYVQWPLPIAQRPENIKVVVCGGRQGGHSYWLQADQRGVSNTAEIKLPANWDLLLRKTEEDLGEIPTDY